MNDETGRAVSGLGSGAGVSDSDSGSDSDIGGVWARFRPDLDSGLRFGNGVAVEVWRGGIREVSENSGEVLRAWGAEDVAELSARDRGGVGELVLAVRDGEPARWHYTVRRASSAERLVRAWRRGESEGGDAGGEEGDSGFGRFGAGDEGGGGRSAALWRLRGFAVRRRGMLGLGFGLTLAGAATGLLPPYLTMPLIDRVLIPRQAGLEPEPGLAVWYLSGLMGAAVATWLLSWARTVVMLRASERIAADLRDATYRHLQGLSLDYFQSKRTGDLISRVSSDTDRICNYLAFGVVEFAGDCLMILLTAAVLLSIDPVLALAALVPFPAIAMLVRGVRGRLRLNSLRASRAWGEMTNVLADAIPGARVVQAFAQEDREVERFRERNRRVLEVNERVATIWGFTGSFVGFLTQVGLLTVWVAGVAMVYRDAVTVGALTAFLAYITRFYTRMESMIRIVQTTQRAGASAERIFEILDRTSSVPRPSEPVPALIREGRIEVRDATFRYGSRAVLRGVNLRVGAGEMVGLAGPSGAGKTTLVNLIARFHDLREGDGAVLVDGVDVRRFDPREYRANVGLVPQEPFLFHGSLWENIGYGRPGADLEEIVDAARAARAHEFAIRLPDGYDSGVGERGHSLSGGERQRVSIARALLVDPRILILDEATSAVDSETERLIQSALENLVRGRTTIAIAHRLSTLRRADRLVVMDEGRIVQEGRHEDLSREESGLYARLLRAQFGQDGRLPEETGEGEGVRANTRASVRLGRGSELRLAGEGLLRLRLEGGGGWSLVRAARGFPFSRPEEFVFFVEEGGGGAEVGWARRLGDLEEGSAAAVREALGRWSFLPRVLEIESIREYPGRNETEWRVVTDRGRSRFKTRGAEELRRLGRGRLLIADDRGLRYEIVLNGLSAGDRRRLERFVPLEG